MSHVYCLYSELNWQNELYIFCHQSNITKKLKEQKKKQKNETHQHTKRDFLRLNEVFFFFALIRTFQSS